ncbi:MAG TPA: 3'-5' exonuclease [Rhodospirillaceae bacterium]|nr:3'-5' exonuclease [Rhodospirillaceae bacterium]
MSAGLEFETMASALEASGDFRLLRRLRPRSRVNENDGSATRLGIFLDLETTGLDARRDEIIEIAMVPFTYALDGRIFDIREPFQRLRQPSFPIPPEITAITGIDDAMVEGQVVDPAEVAAFVAPADLILAHNAGFDRRFAERFCAAFTAKPWGCSQSQIPWKDEGFEGTRLGYLLAGCGLFHDAHRATGDCLAAIEILSRPLPRSGVLALARLLEAARRPTCRVWAENSPFELRTALKARGYRWSDGSDGRPRAWYADVTEDRLDAELKYLRTEIYQFDAEFNLHRITARDRFSDRG